LLPVTEPPEGEDQPGVLLPVGGRPLLDDVLHDGDATRLLHAVEGHVGLHVGLHPRRLLRIGGRGKCLPGVCHDLVDPTHPLISRVPSSRTTRRWRSSTRTADDSSTTVAGPVIPKPAGSVDLSQTPSTPTGSDAVSVPPTDSHRSGASPRAVARRVTNSIGSSGRTKPK